MGTVRLHIGGVIVSILVFVAVLGVVLTIEVAAVGIGVVLASVSIIVVVTRGLTFPVRMVVYVIVLLWLFHFLGLA